MEVRLLWEDTFSKDGKPNPDIWNIDTGGSGFGNNELQFYTDRLDNVFIKDHMLHIIGKKEDYEHRNYTSGKINTFGKKHMKYGRIEVCASLPDGLGTWPAIWMLGANIRDGIRWPRCGEIDIMEHVGKRVNNVWFSLHSEKNNHKINTQITKIYQIDELVKGFHVFRIDWIENQISFYVDDKEYVTLKNENNMDESVWPFNNEFFLIINLALGGNLGGQIDDNSLPQEYKIKYVKVYEWVK